ncbi:hypothetical protein B1A99_11885 [Cohnella sp. CIP 111063]|uniref:DUF2207 domain-containing protein n=1 Tax=unclassified Cohnella TaxID=2636738 RepID=UPI000B8C689D|nr:MULTISPECIES: DUF2207 domain-containing protein [unclassified Cohnella]OXS59315.1 hypothetical protein B1A99_11885 [Cohnella sp. CIP 111063]PRX72340.1 putative membrane protein [Cohnella sp. SGD-V74]
MGAAIRATFKAATGGQKRIIAVAIVVAGLFYSLLLPLLAQPARAEDRSFEISEVEIHASIDRDGNMQVTELDTYHFNGAFNGVLVDLNSSGSDGIEGFQAFEEAGQQSIPLEFEQTADGEKLNYKVYAKSENETKVFRYTYTVKNVVQVYADTSELYWKFFDETNPSDLGKVRIRVELPEGAERERVQAFGHGPASGTLDIEDRGVVRFEMSPLPSGEMLEVRVLFPVSYVPGSAKVSPEAMLERILEEERRWADPHADRYEDEINPYSDPSLYGALVLLIANLVGGTLVYRKYAAKYKPDWKGKYYRELPGDVTPAVVSYLMNYRVASRDLIATLMDLVRKRCVSMQAVEPDEGSRSVFRFRRKKPDYLFRLGVYASKLSPHENLLIRWFFRKIGRSGKVWLSDIREQAEEKEDAAAFVKQWTEWKGAVAKAADPYIETRRPGVRRSILGVALLQFFGFLFLAPEDWKWLMFCAIPLCFFMPPKRRRSQMGQTEFAKWKAFKRFLRDYSRIASREPMAVHLWEHYFVYAISLGEAKRMIAITRVNIPEEVSDQGIMGIGTGYYYADWTHSFDQAVSAAAKTANSSSDSSDGGFFSGGGGGGGGGGGRGAF